MERSSGLVPDHITNQRQAGPSQPSQIGVLMSLDLCTFVRNRLSGYFCAQEEEVISSGWSGSSASADWKLPSTFSCSRSTVVKPTR